MSKTELAECKHRVKFDEGGENNFKCSHPKVFSPLNIVSDKQCMICTARLIEAEPKSLEVEASFGQQATNYISSTVKHIAGGGELLTQDQIDTRLAICQTCEHFDGSKCLKCGCRCNATRSHFLNKLARPHAGCPVGKWEPITS